LIMLGGFAAVAFIKWWESRVSRPREQESIEAEAKAQQELLETIRGITAVKLFRQEDNRDATWTDRQVDAINAQYARELVRGKADLARDLLQAVTLAFIVYVGAGRV